METQAGDTVNKHSSSGANCLITLGGIGSGRLEQLMRTALESACVDLSDRCNQAGIFSSITLITDQPMTIETDNWSRVEYTEPHQSFGDVLETYFKTTNPKFVENPLVYFGAGSAPVIQDVDIADLVSALDRAERNICAANNIYSADYFGVNPGNIIEMLDPSPASDNEIPKRLLEENSTEVVELARSSRSQFNIDVTADLVTLLLADAKGAKIQSFLQAHSQLFRQAIQCQWSAAQHLTNKESQVLVYGRTSSRIWKYLETESASKIRIIGEERGLGTAPPGHHPYSTLGDLIESKGAETFFTRTLPLMCDAAFIDLIPVLAYLHPDTTQEDRHAAFLMDESGIEHSGLRTIIRSINTSPIPIAIGGHTLVGSGIELLNQRAWDSIDGIRPNPY